MALNQERTETRHAYRLLRAIRDSRDEVTPLEYLLADYNDPEEAIAVYNLAVSRAEFSDEPTMEDVG